MIVLQQILVDQCLCQCGGSNRT